MALIQNLVARLTLDSSAFDRNAKASSKSMYGMMASSLSLQRTLVGLTAVYIGARSIYSAIRSVTQAAIQHESAERKVMAALALTGEATRGNLAAIEDYAAALQKQTIYSDEEILNQIAYAKSMGLSTSEIERATTAAIGLAAAYGKDLGQTMKTITLAAKGETGQLKEMGIVLDKSLSAREKYNEVLRQGTEKFHLAQSATEDTAGAAKQLSNSWEDLKKNASKGLLPFLDDFVKGLNLIVEAGNRASTAVSSLFSEKMPPDLRRAAEEEYRQTTGDVSAFRRRMQMTGGEAQEPPAYIGKWQSILAQYQDQWRQQQGMESAAGAAAIGGDGASAMAAGSEQARERVVELNRALDEQRLVQESVNQGQLHAAELLRFNNALAEDYNLTTVEAIKESEEYAKALAALDDLRARAAAGEYLQSLQDEAEVLKLQQQGLKDQAEVQAKVNEFRRENIKLLPEEIALIEEQIKANRRLAEGLDEGFIAGTRRAIRELNEELKTTGRITVDIIKTGMEGLAAAIADAAVEGDDLGDSLRNVGKQIAKMLMEWAVMNAMLAAMGKSSSSSNGWLTQLLTTAAQSLAGSGSSGSSGGMGQSGSGGYHQYHGGGIVGTGGSLHRLAGEWPVYAPRLHAGLQAGEVPAVLQIGEKVTSRAGVAGENRLMGRMVSLLEQMAGRGNVTRIQIVDRRQTPQEWSESREGEQAWQYHASRNP
jgi:hypothetical protein